VVAEIRMQVAKIGMCTNSTDMKEDHKKQRQQHSDDRSAVMADNSKVMSELERQEHGIPPGGTWYKKQDPMLKAYADGKKQGYPAAWDRVPFMKGDKLCVTKAYGLYDSAKDFFNSLLQCAPERRFGYEFFPSDAPCKAHADIEWEGPEEPYHSTLQRLLKYFRERVSELYPEKATDEWEIHVACGTRPAKGMMKHSYHIVISNLVFPCNTAMVQLFAVSKDHSEFWRTGKDGVNKCIVDTSIYTPNRLFRTLYSLKRTLDGSVPPLLRLKNVDEDPCVDEYTDDKYNDRNVDEVLPMVVTYMDSDDAASAIIVPVLPVREGATKKRRRTGGGCKSSKKQKVAVERDVNLPFPMDSLNTALQAHGDTVSQASSYNFIDIEDDDPK
jgi:hypothetical protein